MTANSKERSGILVFTFLIFILASYRVNAASEISIPVQLISSCEIDLNNDGKSDVVLLLETHNGRELMVLMGTEGGGYTCTVLKSGQFDMILSCHFGYELKETSAGKNKEKRKLHHTNGKYLKLRQPEGASVAYYWKDGKFHTVWVSD